MFQVGRLCVKIAGRDAGKKCLIVEVLDDNFVMIDGQTRRRKANIRHLEPLDKQLNIKKGASHKEVVDALKKEKIEVSEKKTKTKTEKPKKQRKSKSKKAAKKIETEVKETKKSETETTKTKSKKESKK